MDVMENSSCELLSLSYPNVSELENLRWTILVNFMLNNFLSYTAIMLNIVTIHAISKTSSLPDTLKTLLLNLAVTDVGVGLIVQPIYCSLLAKWLQQSGEDCNFRHAFVMISSTFCLASFLGVMAVSVDRFLAIHLHLRYQELVTRKQVVVVVISIWTLSVFLPLAMFWISLDISTLVLAVFETNGPNVALKRFFLFSVTLIHLNSSLNPVIYCWKMRHIRHAIMDILRNMCWLKNRASHLP